MKGFRSSRQDYDNQSSVLPKRLIAKASARWLVTTLVAFMIALSLANSLALAQGPSPSEPAPQKAPPGIDPFGSIFQTQQNKDASPQAIAACPPTSCTAGRDVGRDFFAQVVGRLSDVPPSDFAVDALMLWKPWENTSACWNPLATTWKMETICNFNSVGVQNYQNQDMGVRATANTLNQSYYNAIRRMLKGEAFDREGMRAALRTWGTCHDAGCDGLLNNWQQLWNARGVTVRTVSTTAGDNNVKGTFQRGDTIRYWASISNSLGGTARANLSWSVTGSRSLLNWSGLLDLSNGTSNWYIESTIPSDAPGGVYTLTVSSSYNGQNSSQSTTFIVQGGSVTPCDTPSNQFCVEYYNNPSLSGSPTFKTTEGSINHDWGSGGPGNGVGNDRFSARWRGSFNLAAGTYTFTATADDGVRVYVDGNLIIDQWRDQGPTTYNASRVLSGGNHEIKVEYYENGGGAVARVSWQQSVTVCSTYTATYYNNRNLSDPAMFVRCEGWPIDQNWGNGGPGNGIGNDNFSARWTGRARIDAGTYTFVAGADDGIRVWLDGSLIIDQWRDQGYTEYRATRSVSSGDHDIKVEYYENGGGARVYFRWDRVSSGCGNDTYEPNDNRLFGKEISQGQTITAYICPSGDIDWYRFHVVLGQQIRVDLFNVPADYDLYLFDSNGRQITSSTLGGTNNETINWQANCGGSFGCDVWIEVIGYNGAWSDSRSYNLQWSVR